MRVTDVNQLSPERRRDWEAARSHGERENLLVLWDLEDQQAAANAPPSDEAGKKEAAEVKSDAVDELKQPEVSEPVETQTHDQADPTQTVDYWMKLAEENAAKEREAEAEAEKWKKRKGDADRHLEPVQQENAKLKREKAEILDRFEQLEAKFEKLLNGSSRKPEVFLDPNDEFAQNYGEVAERIEQRIAAVRDQMERKYQEEILPIKEKLSFHEAATEQEHAKARILAHRAVVAAAHPDVDDFFNPNKYGPALAEWAKTQSPITGRILNSPVEFDEADLIDVLSRFKLAAGFSKQAKTPSHADIATRVNSHTNVAPPAPPADIFDDVFGEKELNSQLAIINRTVFDAGDKVKNNELQQKAMDDLLNKWERTLTKRYK